MVNDDKIQISSNFDAGNIEVVSANDLNDIQLKIRPDPFCKGDDTTHFQWFYFRVTGCKGKDLQLKIVNAGESSFPVAWPKYNTCASYDAINMFRIPTTYDKSKGVLSWKIKPEHDSIYFSYWVPYSYAKHQDLIARMQMNDKTRLEVLGQTLDGRDLDLLTVGEPGNDKKSVWIIARQHPGESMAEWFMEGFLDELTDPHNAFSNRALKHAVFYVVPNVNPDGAIRGHLRTNAAGANLNREWATPTMVHSPEVKVIKDKMTETDVDFFLDVHGDEEIPFNFLAGIEGIPAFDDHLKTLSTTFTKAFERATPDFQAKPGYEVDPPGKANLEIGSNAVGQDFRCLSFTLEMPFKDTEDSPDPVSGWSPERAKRFGASVLSPIYEVLPLLRDVPKSRKK